MQGQTTKAKERYSNRGDALGKYLQLRGHSLACSLQQLGHNLASSIHNLATTLHLQFTAIDALCLRKSTPAFSLSLKQRSAGAHKQQRRYCKLTSGFSFHRCAAWTSGSAALRVFKKGPIPAQNKNMFSCANY